MPRSKKAPRRCSLITGFWRNIERRGPDDCWHWRGNCWSKDRGTSYGLIVIGARKELAHRFMLEMTIGPIGSQFALHNCDNPPCCNPKHLYAGTAADNGRDVSARGRHPSIHRGALAKYQTTPLALWLDDNSCGMGELAARAGVAKFSVTRILRGEKCGRSVVEKISIATGVSAMDLVGLEISDLPLYGRDISEATARSVTTGYQAGMTFRDLAAQHGMRVMTVHKLVCDLGLPLRGKGNRSNHSRPAQTA